MTERERLTIKLLMSVYETSIRAITEQAVARLLKETRIPPLGAQNRVTLMIHKIASDIAPGQDDSA